MRWKTAAFVCLTLALLALPALAGTPDLKPQKAEVLLPVAAAESPSFRDMPIMNGKAPIAHRVIPNRAITKDMDLAMPQYAGPDPLVKDVPPAAPMPSPLINFDGIANLNGVAPPDTQGDIGPDHYVQWINCSIEGWSINRSTWTATPAFGPVDGNTIWTALGGQCASDNWGDPIVLWDRFRSRWVISQFSLGPSANGPFKTAIAVSKTADPSGAWWLYCYDYSPTVMNDYPKFGVWPDGYYYTCNQFAPSWNGAGVAVFEADKMISGDPTAKMLKIDMSTVSLNYGNMLPAHFEGTMNPPAGAPGYFVEVDDTSWFSPPLPNDTISLWKAHVNFSTDTFTVGVAGAPDLQIPIANFTPLCMGTRSCIPQPPGGENLDAIGDRAMYRCQYRNFGSFEAMVFNLTVDSGSARAGIRWFELRKDSGHPDWYLYQEGTYAPADTLHRWMGSAAQDHNGNLAIGYSASNSSTYPEIGYAGRLAGDPLGTLPQSEVILHAGPGAQNTGYSRWGDYSTMSIDPVDDCTFWYTQEYVTAAGGWEWATRIGAFKFPGCSIGPTGTLAGTVTASAGGTPIVGATVSATDGGTTVQTLTGAGGVYTMTLPVATYDVTASAFGYNPATVNSVVITEGATTTQNFSLTSAGTHTVDGTVSDSGTGWPLYATIAITGDMGYPGTTIYTNPADGYYSITLVDGVTYGFTVTPWVSGYTPGTATVGPLAADATQDFALVADASACNAPGYGLDYKWFQDFEAGDGGFTTSGTTSWAYGVPTSGPGSAHSPTHAWATNLSGNYNNSENGYITSPVIDLSSFSGDSVILEWWQWLQSESGYDYASVEATSDGVTWNVVYGTVSGTIDSSWAKHSVVLGATYATASFQFRFHFTSDSSASYPGWYVDDVGVAALTVAPPPPPLLSEGFEGSFPPSGWSTVDNIGSGNVWERNDYFSASNNTGGTGYCADADSDATCGPSAWDTSLISPSVVLPAGATNLIFKSNFQDYIGSGEAWCDISTDGGSNWANLFYTTNDEPGPTTHTISLAPYVSTTAIFRWRYSDNGDGCAWYWRIDDVSIPDPLTPPPPTVSCVAPAGGGLIYGNVYDANTMTALSGAAVSNSTTGKSVATAVTPDPNVDDGFYCMYGAEGTNDLSATKTLYGTDSQSPTVPHFGVVQQDFALATGQLAASPASFTWTTGEGGTGGGTLTLSNIGAADVTWNVKELPGHVAKPNNNLFTLNLHRPALTKIQMMNKAAREEMEERAREKDEAGDIKDLKAKEGKRIVLSLDGEKKDPAKESALQPFSTRGGSGDRVLPTPRNPWPPSGPVQLYVDDGLAEDSIGLTSGGQFVWFNRFTPNPADFPFILDQVSVIFNNSVAVGDSMELVVYADPDGDPNNGATFLYSQNVTVLVNDLSTWNDYALTTPVLCSGPGDVLVGLVNRSGASGYYDYPAAIDMTASQLRSWIGSYGGPVPDPPTFPTPSNWGIIDVITGGSLAGNWTVRASGYPADIPWLDENPKSGSVAAGSSVDIDVTYDATGLAPGIYEATLSFENDTPYGPLNVPVTLTVVEPVVPVATADVTSGTAPLAVNFTGTATGGIGTYTYDWDFGDGSPHSAAQNPSHTYNIGGNFTVTLTVTASVVGSGVDNHLVITVTPPAIPIVNNFYDDLPRNLEQACFNRLTGAYVWTVLSGPHADTVFTGTAAVFNGGAKFTNKAGDPNKFSVVYDPVRHRASGWLISGGVYYPLSDSNTLNNPGGCY